ncbi:DUF3800 domain-containing protein [Bdellovibrio sp. HCB117]|uniref:DUF3800 domain-containing protein n=1 Tax=Bdellovibrio sp. HCB117 TaxID=3394359 RepID=UPI0039B580AA
MEKIVYRILCDESCHLEHDDQPAMVLGALKVQRSKARELNEKLRNLKAKHGIHPNQELKWNFVSQQKLQLYIEVIDLFFSEPSLSFRAVAAHKEGLNHAKFDQTHGDWFFKIYYLLLGKLLNANEHYEVFMDPVDTASPYRAQELKEFLNNSFGGKEVITRFQVLDSKRSPLMQISDLFVGAIGYKLRGLQTNSAKLQIIDEIQKRASLDLKSNSRYSANKFNLFHWDMGKK